MKKTFIVFLLFMLIGSTARAQPSYIELLTYFFKHYSYEQPDLLDFARKKDGWYVYTRNAEPPYLTGDMQLLYQNSTGKYHSVARFDAPATDWDVKMQTYLYSPMHIGNWNGFERCRYFGYDTWAEDVIKDYAEYTGPNDTLIESLARAYSAMADKYLWYQEGGNYNGVDTLQKPPAMNQPISRAKAAMAMQYFDKAITTFATLAKRNPSYLTMIGASGVKYQNEIINAWEKLREAGYDKEAEQYLAKVKPDDNAVIWGKNFLASCPKDAVLFSYGDDETYDIWWVQQRLGIRNDVAVVNTSLLGSTRYLDLLKRKNIVPFSALPSQYRDSTQSYAYLTVGASAESKTYNDVRELLRAILNKEGEPVAYGAHTYNLGSETLYMQWKPRDVTGIPTGLNLDNRVAITLGSTIMLGDVIMLDIISQNINTRPICITSVEGNMLGQQLASHGLVSWLLPVADDSVATNAYNKWEIEQLQNYMHNDRIKWTLPVIVDIAANGIAYKEVETYYKIALYDIAHGKAGATNTIADTIAHMARRMNDANACIMAASLMLANSRLQEGKALGEMAALKMISNYNHPSLLNGYVAYATVQGQLEAVQRYLREGGAESALINNLMKQVPKRR